MSPAALAQREDLIRWAREFVDERFNAWLLSVMWYPRYQPLGKVAGYAFMQNIAR